MCVGDDLSHKNKNRMYSFKTRRKNKLDLFSRKQEEERKAKNAGHGKYKMKAQI